MRAVRVCGISDIECSRGCKPGEQCQLETDPALRVKRANMSELTNDQILAVGGQHFASGAKNDSPRAKQAFCDAVRDVIRSYGYVPATIRPPMLVNVRMHGAQVVGVDGPFTPQQALDHSRLSVDIGHGNVRVVTTRLNTPTEPT